MRILVTGGTGFTGKALVRRLLDLGHEVVALDYKEGLKTAELRDWGAEVIIGSVTDAAVVRRAMEGVEVVHHLAAAFREMNVPDTYYWEVNVQGTRNVLDAALKQGVRKLVYCSTCGVHGNIDHPPGRRGRADPARRLLPAHQVRGRAARPRRSTSAACRRRSCARPRSTGRATPSAS